MNSGRFATVSIKRRSTTELDVREYKKDGAVRGHVLGAAEEINLQLEDHLLNLQTMSGSRFVGRYAQKVRTWEKTLNMVVETLDVWYNVQRKWMYLESIFIGADSASNAVRFLNLNFGKMASTRRHAFMKPSTWL